MACSFQDICYVDSHPDFEANTVCKPMYDEADIYHPLEQIRQGLDFGVAISTGKREGLFLRLHHCILPHWMGMLHILLGGVELFSLNISHGSLFT